MTFERLFFSKVNLPLFSYWCSTYTTHLYLLKWHLDSESLFLFTTGATKAWHSLLISSKGESNELWDMTSQCRTRPPESASLSPTFPGGMAKTEGTLGVGRAQGALGEAPRLMQGSCQPPGFVFQSPGAIHPTQTDRGEAYSLWKWWNYLINTPADTSHWETQHRQEKKEDPSSRAVFTEEALRTFPRWGARWNLPDCEPGETRISWGSQTYLFCCGLPVSKRTSGFSCPGGKGEVWQFSLQRKSC